MIPILLSMQCRLVHIFVVAVVFWMDGRIGCPVLFYTLFIYVDIIFEAFKQRVLNTQQQSSSTRTINFC